MRVDAVKKFLKGLTWSQMTAAALAAVTALLLSKQLGVAGSVVGAAVSSIVSTVASTIYKNTLNEGAKAVKKNMGIPTETTIQAKLDVKNAAGDGKGATQVAGANGSAGKDRTTVIGSTTTTAMPRQGADATVAYRGGHFADDNQQPFDDGSSDAIASLDDMGTEAFPRVAGTGSAYGAASAYTGTNPYGSHEPYEPTQRWDRASTYSRYADGAAGGTVRAREGHADPYDATRRDASPASTAWQGANAASATRGGGRGQLRLLIVGLLAAVAALAISSVLINVITAGNGLGQKISLLGASVERTVSSVTDAAAGSSSASSAADGANGSSNVAASAASNVTSAITTATQAIGGAINSGVNAVTGGAGTAGTTTTSPSGTGNASGGTGATAGAGAGAGEGAGTATGTGTTGTGADTGTTGDTTTTGTEAGGTGGTATGTGTGTGSTATGTDAGTTGGTTTTGTEAGGTGGTTSTTGGSETTTTAQAAA